MNMALTMLLPLALVGVVAVVAIVLLIARRGD